MNTSFDSSKPVVYVSGLRKFFRVPIREAGLRAAVASLVHRRTREVRAVDGISFEIAPGEVVGFLGPNGAGKTTTLKMLSGLLYPTGGEVRVLGNIPSRRSKDLLRQISFVMGQRNQLTWDIPAIDSFDLNRALYGLAVEEYQHTRDELIEIMGLEELVNKPVRNLSLGERMRVEIVGALLHRPRVLFLDEPTIGLDVTMQRRIREFVRAYNQRYGASVLLTSHYMADVEALCRRVIIIHHGKLLYDGDLSALVDQFSSHKTIVMTLAEGPAEDLFRYGEIVKQEENRVTLRVERGAAPQTMSQLLASLPVTDLTVEDVPIEEVIERVFAQEMAE